MKTLSFIVFCLFSAACLGQTKLVAYRSHSGSDANLRTAIDHEMFDMPNSNLGIAPGTYITKIDSVILVGHDQMTVVRNTYYTYQGKTKRAYTMRDTVTKAAYAEMFSASNADELKAVLSKKYKTFKTDSTRFIGFSKKFSQKKG